MTVVTTKGFKELSITFLKEVLLAIMLILALQLIFRPAFADDSSTPSTWSGSPSSTVYSAGHDR